MIRKIAAAFTLLAANSLNAQPMPDLSTATPIDGAWAYVAVADGSTATYTNAAGYPQIWLRCTRATRHVTVARPASVAAPFLNLWTSSLTRSIPSSFNPASGRLTIDLGAYDPLFDAMASSRGRMAVAVGTQPALVVPTWAEVARVIEDCRA